MGPDAYVPDSFIAHSSSVLNDNSSMVNVSTPYPDISNASVPINPANQCHPCQLVLYKDVADSNVRYWDLAILIPNVIFLLFLAMTSRTAVAKLRRTSSPIFLAFYGLVMLVAVISVLRCIVSMTVNASVKAADIADQVLWLVLRFFLLATELSVVIFGLAFGHLDSKTSIQRVLLVTFSIALVYSCTQGVLEFMFPDDRFHVSTDDEDYDIFGHGGMQFWFASSVFFFVIYSVICILPFTKVRQRFALPTKRAFYWYCLFLAVMNLIQAIGSGLLHYDFMYGMCVVDVTTYIYFTCFTPLVYFTFLREFFKTSLPPSILFSYKAHVNDDEDDNMGAQSSQQSTNELHHVVDYNTASLDDPHSPNPLYHDPHSPNPLYHGPPEPEFSNVRPQLTIQAEYFDGPEDV